MFKAASRDTVSREDNHHTNLCGHRTGPRAILRVNWLSPQFNLTALSSYVRLEYNNELPRRTLKLFKKVITKTPLLPNS